MVPIKKHLLAKNNSQGSISKRGFKTVEMDHSQINATRQKVAINE